MSGGGGEEGETSHFTPTWVVAAVCTVIVAISLGFQRLLHYLGVCLKTKHNKPLLEALQKVKEGLNFSLALLLLLLFVFPYYVGWWEKVKKKKESTIQSSSHSGLQLGRIFRNASAAEDVQPESHGSDGSK